MHVKIYAKIAAILSQPQCVNSLPPGKCEWNFRYVTFKWISVIDGWGISCEIALLWMSLNFTDDQSTLVQVMAWCRQATSHYLSQCWPRSMSPYGVTRPQCVNSVSPGDAIWHQRAWSTLVQIISGLMPEDTKSLSEPMLTETRHLLEVKVQHI